MGCSLFWSLYVGWIRGTLVYDNFLSLSLSLDSQLVMEMATSSSMASHTLLTLWWPLRFFVPHQQVNYNGILHWIAYYCWWKIRVGIINMGHTNFLVKVELTWVQDPWSFHKSSWSLPSNTIKYYLWHKSKTK